MLNTISKEKLDKYFEVTGRALKIVKESKKDLTRIEDANDFLDMASRYFSDAKHFQGNDDWVNAFAAINYAHGWLDAGARIGLFKVKDNMLFTVDEE